MLTKISSLAVRTNNLYVWKTLNILSFGYERAELEAMLVESARRGYSVVWKASFVAMGRRASPEVWRDSLANAALSGNVALFHLIETAMRRHSNCEERHLSLDRILSGAVQSGNMDMLDHVVLRFSNALAQAYWPGLMCSAVRSKSPEMMECVLKLAPREVVNTFEWNALALAAVSTNNFATIHWVCGTTEYTDRVNWSKISGSYNGGDELIQARLNRASDISYSRYMRRQRSTVQPLPAEPHYEPTLLKAA